VISGALVSESFDRLTGLGLVQDATSKPIVFTTATAISFPEAARCLIESIALPVVPGLPRALRSISAAVEYHKMREEIRRPRERASVPSPSIRINADAVGVNNSILRSDETRALLLAFGINVARQEVVGTVQAALAAAERIGYPVAVKLCNDVVPHKMEVGGIRLNLGNATAVKRAYQEMDMRLSEISPRINDHRMLVQEFVTGGLELILGVSNRERGYPPIVLVGSGGSWADILRDTVTCLVPIDRDDARRMLQSLRSYRFFSGFRGLAPLDETAAIDAIVGLSRLAESAHSQVGEIDLNPIVVRPNGSGAVVVDALVVLKADTGGANPMTAVRVI
jgi:acyl-CoA synthetase (NDP forming)